MCALRSLPAAEPKDTLSLAETARRVGVDRQTLARWIDRGEFPGYHIGDRYVIPRKGFERWLDVPHWQPKERSLA